MGATGAHAQQLCSWIGQRTGTAPTLASLRLVYQATVDGFGAAQCHAKIDGKPRLLVVVRAATGHLFGGYSTSAHASHGSFISCQHAFLFTLTNPHGVAPTMLPTSDASYAVYGGNGVCCLSFSAGCWCLVDRCDTNGGSQGNPKYFTDPTGRGAALFTGAAQLGLISEILCFSC